MNKTFVAHPITILYQLRAWWIVFTAPIVRRILQLVLSREVQKILLSEIVALALAFVMSIIGWLSTRVAVYSECIVIKKGIFLKTRTTIDFSRLLGISTDKNLFYAIVGCARCRFNTVSEKDKKCEVKLKTTDARHIYDIVYGEISCLPIKRQKRIKRFLFIPTFLLIVCLFVAFTRLALKQTDFYGFCALLILILYYISTCYYDYKKGKLILGERVFARRVSMRGSKTFRCLKNDIGVMKIIQTPIDRYQNTCKIKVILLGENGDNIKIRHLKYENAIHQIKTALKTNKDV